jgi:hypothetical protein
LLRLSAAEEEEEGSKSDAVHRAAAAAAANSLLDSAQLVMDRQEMARAEVALAAK